MLIFLKAVRLSAFGLKETNVGEIVNLLSSDVNRFEGNLIFLLYIILSLIQLPLFSYFLWKEVGAAALSGVCALLLLTPLQCKDMILKSVIHQFLTFVLLNPVRFLLINCGYSF